FISDLSRSISSSSYAISRNAFICSLTASVDSTTALPLSVNDFSTFGDCSMMSLFSFNNLSISSFVSPLFSASSSYRSCNSATLAGFCVCSSSFWISSMRPSSSVLNLDFVCSESYSSTKASTLSACSNMLSATSVDISCNLPLSLCASYNLYAKQASAPPATIATPVRPPNNPNLPIKPFPLARPNILATLPPTVKTLPVAVATPPSAIEAGPTAATTPAHFNICFC